MTTAPEKTPAFRAAMDALAQVQPSTTTDLVQFVSHGKALLLAPPAQENTARTAAQSLAPELNARVSTAQVEVQGHLGAFQVQDDTIDASNPQQADIIIDYHQPPLLQQQHPRVRTLPLGYFSAAEQGEDALASARTMTGTFTKPKYFTYDSSVCAHAHSGVQGCSRCLDACATQAITSQGDKIAVDPHLCQGCGGCVLTCPSGALRYAYPTPKDMLEALRAALHAYAREETSHAPTVLFYAAECATTINAAHLPPHILPIAVEEAGVAGLEIWFATFAYGAGQVVLFADNPGIATLAQAQLQTAHALLDALNLPTDALRVLTEDALPELAEQAPTAQPRAAPAQFAADNDKRHIFFMALNHFVAQATLEDEIIPLPEGAPFGEVAVDARTCTLCMACAGACPVSAIRAGNTAPRLTFVEENCLQCGLCAATCPEDAITLTPQLNTDKSARRQARLLNEDKPLHCLKCQKPFASERIISKMEEKLKGHWMFQQPQELRRLRLCEDCRVIEMFDGGGGGAQ